MMRCCRISGIHVWPVAVALWVLGCAEAEPTLAPVSGTVTFNGLPCRAEVIFEPDRGQQQPGGRPSSGFAGEDGRFTLHYTEDRAGARVGRHRVLIKILQSTNDSQTQSYREAVEPVKIARLHRTVSSGKNDFRFAITY